MTLAASLVLAVISSSLLALANHVTCSWTDEGVTDPEHHGYSPFCTAQRIDQEGPFFSIYKCIDNHEKVVADYGYIAFHSLEFRTPCGGGGYGVDCDAFKAWAVCIGDNTTDAGKTRPFEPLSVDIYKKQKGRLRLRMEEE